MKKCGKEKLDANAVNIVAQLHDHGASYKDLLRVATDEAYAKKIAEYIHLSDDYVYARAALGPHRFFGKERWLEYPHFLTISPDQLQGIETFPWNESILNAPCPFAKEKMVRDTHFAFFAPSLSIKSLHNAHFLGGCPRHLIENTWYGNKRFANEIIAPHRWHLMPIMSPFTDKTWCEQMHMIPQGYEMASAITVIFRNTLLQEGGTQPLNERCRNRTIHGQRVVVGPYTGRRFAITAIADSEHNPSLSIALTRKRP